MKQSLPRRWTVVLLRRARTYGTTVAVALAVMMGLAAASARAAEDPREVQGRALFAKGSYQEALDTFAVLFAEKADPLYLRNIGRCHQKLRQPDKAIDAFREYLRRSRPRPAEREEVEGFIREMEELKRTLPAETAGSPATAEVRPVPAAPPPPPAAHPAAPAPAALVEASPAPPAESAGAPAQPLTRRWWFWAAIGAVVVGGVVTAVALSAGGGSPPGCPEGFTCPP